ncbi:MAG: hypothetical protein ACR2P0_07225 [Acidimicrobiales bacterium]
MDDPHNITETAWNLFHLGRHGDAAEHAARSLSMAPGDPSTLRLLAEIALATDDQAEAQRIVVQALDAEDSVASHLLAARVFDAIDDHTTALHEVDRAIHLDPDAAYGHALKALLIGRRRLCAADHRSPPTEDEFVSAAEAAERAIHLDPDLPFSHYAAAVVATACGELTRAAAMLDAALELRPDWPEAHLMLGSVRARQGMVKLSTRHFAIAGRLDPQDETAIRALRTIGWADRSRLSRAIARRLGRGRRTEPAHVVPEARSILAADARLRSKDSAT